MCTLSLSCLHLFILIVFYYFHLVYLRLLSCERLSPNAVLGQNLLPWLNNLNAMQGKVSAQSSDIRIVQYCIQVYGYKYFCLCSLTSFTLSLVRDCTKLKPIKQPEITKFLWCNKYFLSNLSVSPFLSLYLYLSISLSISVFVSTYLCDSLLQADKRCGSDVNLLKCY